MMRGDGGRMLRVTLVAAVLALAAATWPSTGAPQVFRAMTDVVTLPVTVTGRGEVLMTGLALEDFAVLEDGRPQTVRYFASGIPPEVPLHLGVLLDASGSMQRDLSAAVSAAIRFVNELDEVRSVTFVEFADDVRVSQFAPAGFPRMFERMRGVTARGYTALYDAVAMYLSTTEAQDGQKVLLLYSDGGDSRSTTRFDEIVEMLRLSQVVVYVIGYVQHQSGAERALQQMRMQTMARETGGAVFHPDGRADLERIYARIRDELLGRYTLGYVSTNPATDGRYRKVQVRLTRDLGRGAAIRTRTGYYAPVR